jgi:diguanylate cyclase (GGDEF)-like protein
MRDVAAALIVRLATALGLRRRATPSVGTRARVAGGDPITGLPGRPVIHERAECVLERLGPDERAAILLLDVDGFRLLNDSFGHAAGDEVLMALGERLSATVREGDIVARVGADEFAVLCERVSSVDEATGLARRLLAAMSSPFNVHDQQVSLGARVGIAVSGPTARTLVDLVHDADMAMSAAKSSNSRWAVFKPEMREASRRFLATASDLRRAASRRQLRVEYQPIVTLPNGDLVAFEALVRWAHPNRGLISPSEFIPVAEQAGLGGSSRAPGRREWR